MIFWRCKHLNTRCLHGDEIIWRMSWRGAIRRQACVDCDKTLDRDLPDVCTVTGEPHYVSSEVQP